MKYIFLILATLVSLTVNAQVNQKPAEDTVMFPMKQITKPFTEKQVEPTKDTTKIEIPAWVAKQIALDLLSGDSAKAALKLTQQILKNTEQKVTFQDSLLKAYQVKNQTYAQQILNYKEKEKKYIEYTKTLKSDVKKAKFKNRLATGVGTLAGLAGLLLLFIAN